jgi:hypothetical protein
MVCHIKDNNDANIDEFVKYFEMIVWTLHKYNEYQSDKEAGTAMFRKGVGELRRKFIQTIKENNKEYAL